MVADLTNQIIIVVPSKWKLITNANCSKEGNYGVLKLTDQILEIVECVIEKLTRQQV